MNSDRIEAKYVKCNEMGGEGGGGTKTFGTFYCVLDEQNCLVAVYLAKKLVRYRTCTLVCLTKLRDG